MALVYATVEQLRVELGLAADDEAGLSTVDATRFIENAQDRIDRRLRNWPIVTTGIAAGRRIPVEDAGFEVWQADALARATVKLAAHEQQNPALYKTGERSSVSGPDFSWSGRIESRQLDDAWAALDASGLLDGAGMTRITI